VFSSWLKANRVLGRSLFVPLTTAALFDLQREFHNFYPVPPALSMTLPHRNIERAHYFLTSLFALFWSCFPRPFHLGPLLAMYSPSAPLSKRPRSRSRQLRTLCATTGTLSRSPNHSHCPLSLRNGTLLNLGQAYLDRYRISKTGQDFQLAMHTFEHARSQNWSSAVSLDRVRNYALAGMRASGSE